MRAPSPWLILCYGVITPHIPLLCAQKTPPGLLTASKLNATSFQVSAAASSSETEPAAGSWQGCARGGEASEGGPQSKAWLTAAWADRQTSVPEASSSLAQHPPSV